MSPSLTADTAIQQFDLRVELIEQSGIAEQVNLFIVPVGCWLDGV